MNEKDLLKKIIDSALGLDFKVKEIVEGFSLSSIPFVSMTLDKELVETLVTKLKELHDKSEFLCTEMGVDISALEGEYLGIIENLLMVILNPVQLEVLEFYLHNSVTDKEWDGKLNLEVNNEVKSYDISTVDNLWKVIEELKQVNN